MSGKVSMRLVYRRFASTFCADNDWASTVKNKKNDSPTIINNFDRMNISSELSKIRMSVFKFKLSRTGIFNY